MAGPFDHLIGVELDGGSCSWNQDRAMLYAVGVGAGLDDPSRELHFTTENTPGVTLQVIPTFMTIMGTEGDWLSRFNLGEGGGYPVGVVHGEQGVALARPIPPEGKVTISRKLIGAYDKGSGALLIVETQATLADSGEYLGSSAMGLFCQGKGGFGGPRNPPGDQGWSRPERAPDMTVSSAVGLNQSLIYRLLGDHNLHGTDFARARLDGFERPVFYGLGTYGVACRALVGALRDGDATDFRRIDARFSKPVHPGDRLETRIWRTDDGAVFQMFANGERLVLDRGVFHLAGS